MFVGKPDFLLDAIQLEQYPLELKDGMGHVRQLAGALAKYGHQIREAIIASSEAGDPTTSDLFTQISRGVDEYLWKVEAHRYAK
ncbi:hypothetical protein PQR67_30035 [Paraburkholderia fungorum]|uniref:hypothetical protein n=1 Tax=Paraburkholderia fungorum TaxID=134537 RepID=UPI0038BDF9AD